MTYKEIWDRVLLCLAGWSGSPPKQGGLAYTTGHHLQGTASEVRELLVTGIKAVLLMDWSILPNMYHHQTGLPDWLKTTTRWNLQEGVQVCSRYILNNFQISTWPAFPVTIVLASHTCEASREVDPSSPGLWILRVTLSGPGCFLNTHLCFPYAILWWEGGRDTCRLQGFGLHRRTDRLGPLGPWTEPYSGLTAL